MYVWIALSSADNCRVSIFSSSLFDISAWRNGVGERRKEVRGERRGQSRSTVYER